MRRILLALFAVAFFTTGFTLPAMAAMAEDLALIEAADTKTPDFDLVEELLNTGANVAAKDTLGDTALMKAAARNEDTMVAELLIGWGADVNATNNRGETPLMKAAALNRNPQMALVLLRLGGDIEIRDANYKTALDYARQNSDLRGSEALNEMLIMNGERPADAQEVLWDNPVKLDRSGQAAGENKPEAALE